MKLIVGLGNPGEEYAESRHNIGFMVLDMLAKKLEAVAFSKNKKLKSEITFANIGDEKLVMAKTMTFMNNSGEAVINIANFYKVEPQNIWVIYDDLDLPLGTLRIRKEGSAGTHNGMKSLVQTLGHQNFPRFRVGIESRGKTAPEKQETVSFVLSPFMPEEQKTLELIIQKTVEALIYSLKSSIDAGMNKYNVSST